ncbi:izumo sperm-egg fusion protein 1-like isoform X2 [Hyaena hyaena]|uniref:izumo sperm-egg fusion protein 1-like isoform X2 n=1 Tax=Hyaena hyaena TaxID=95912 RepID=UPI0019219F33|nr:izumo sperm-egg fusion protein 1-like isoform X2 [Hyaena hyaena]
MGPQLALLVGALAWCLLSARGCVICDRRVLAALDSLDKEYLPTHLAPERHREVMETIRQTVENFRDLPDLEDPFMGVIDEATMHMAVLSFLRSVKLIRNSDVAGTMLQLLIWCSNCKKQLHVCRKSRDCGVRQINVHEKEDMILDCELNWHKFSQGLTNYSFYRVWGSNSETLLYKGRRPTLTQRLVMPEDAGNYRCELGTVRSGPATVIHFQVTVLPKRVIEEIPKPNTGIQNQRFGSLKRSECLKPEKEPRGFLLEMLTWGFVFLIIGFATAVLCFRYGTVIHSINLWFRTDKAAAPQDEVKESRPSQSPLSQTQVPPEPTEKATAPNHK